MFDMFLRISVASGSYPRQLKGIKAVHPHFIFGGRLQRVDGERVADNSSDRLQGLHLDRCLVPSIHGYSDSSREHKKIHYQKITTVFISTKCK